MFNFKRELLNCNVNTQILNIFAPKGFWASFWSWWAGFGS